MASEFNNLECVKALFDENFVRDPSRPHMLEPDKADSDPLIDHQSLVSFPLHITKIRLSWFSLITALCIQRGMTALMLAAVKGHKEVVFYLLERRADTKLKCKVWPYTMLLCYIL